MEEISRIGIFVHNGVRTCFETHLEYDQAGACIDISFYPLDDPNNQENWVLYREDIVDWAQAHSDWFEYLYLGRLMLNLNAKVSRLEYEEDEGYVKSRNELLCEFSRVAEARGLELAKAVFFKKSLEEALIPRPACTEGFCPN